MEYEYYKRWARLDDGKRTGHYSIVRRAVEPDDYEYDAHKFEYYDVSFKYWNYSCFVNERVWKNGDTFERITEEELFLELV